MWYVYLKKSSKARETSSVLVIGKSCSPPSIVCSLAREPKTCIIGFDVEYGASASAVPYSSEMISKIRRIVRLTHPYDKSIDLATLQSKIWLMVVKYRAFVEAAQYSRGVAWPTQLVFILDLICTGHAYLAECTTVRQIRVPVVLYSAWEAFLPSRVCSIGPMSESTSRSSFRCR